MKNCAMSIIGIIFLLLNTCNASAAETFTFATHARPPLSNFLRELLTEAFKPYNMNIVVDEMPGKRVIKMVNGGLADGDPCRVINFKEISNDDTSNYVIVDEPVANIKIVMVTRRNTEVGDVSWASVNQGMALYLRGSKRIRKNIGEPNRCPADSIQQALTMLQLGRVHSAVLFRSVAESELRKNPDLKNDLIIHEKPITSYNMYVYLHKKHLSFVPELKQSLKKLKTDGIFRQIAEKYLISVPVTGQD